MAVTSEALPRAVVQPTASRILLVSNPNTGKTTLFNQLTGLRHKTSNFPGTTLDLRTGRVRIDGVEHEVYDMPGVYSLESGNEEERTAISAILSPAGVTHRSDIVLLLLDATNLTRNLYLASQILELGKPVVIGLTMSDLAEKRGFKIDVSALAEHLGCAVCPIVPRTGRGIPDLLDACGRAITDPRPAPRPKLLVNEQNPTQGMRYAWAETVTESCVVEPPEHEDRLTRRLDAILTHSVTGVLAFAAVMFGVFYLIFSLATVPMDLIDSFMGSMGELAARFLPEGLARDMLVDGVIAGVGGVLVFLPQICILFFCISLLEDSGYLARAACLMDRLLRHIGLPGKAFVPMLSAHACAIPAIMSARVIEDRRDRLVTILVLPLLTCSARLPVYAMLTALLFPGSPLKVALAFTGAYCLGIGTALAMAFVFRRTMVRTPAAPLMLELPGYKMPSLKTAFFAAYDRGIVFIRKAGTVILALSIILWWLMTFPTYEPTTDAGVNELAIEQQALEYSFAGRLGHALEPVIEPLGYDWRIGVGIVSSFAAREVLVSSLSVIFGAGAEDSEESVLLDKLHAATRADGTPVFTFATSAGLLVFFVLAMQCLPTQAVTRRETGRWRWAVLQWTYMTVLAYLGGFVTYQGLSALGWG
jgi:ferrous iron transport protein B